MSDKIKNYEELIDSLQKENNELKEKLNQYENTVDNLADQLRREKEQHITSNLYYEKLLANYRSKNTNKNISKNTTKKSSSTGSKGTKGRPKLIDENTKNQIIKLRNDGLSIRAIAEKVNFSIGSINNIISNSKKS